MNPRNPEGTLEQLEALATPDQLLEILDGIPRIPLAHLPTPLELLQGESLDPGRGRVWIKRDDQTGLAFGGNKARKLEHIMADVVGRGADSVVTWGGVQSNWCRQVAAAAAKARLRAVLVLLGKPDQTPGVEGNLLLDHLFGADVRVLAPPEGKSFLELENLRDLLDPVLASEAEAGRRPYLLPVGGSLLEGDLSAPLGALGYVRGFAELLEQARLAGFRPDAVVLATGSSGTQAGLMVGARLLAPSTRILGISVAGEAEAVSGYVKKVGDALMDFLGFPVGLDEDRIEVHDSYLAPGYGVLTPEVAHAIRMLARQDGILLDPVYTGKAMRGFLDLRNRGKLDAWKNIVFLHTGGTPALFPYGGGLMDMEPGPGS